jgi:hypothetical protein
MSGILHWLHRFCEVLHADAHDEKLHNDGQSYAVALSGMEWIEWAERQADRIDPLKPSPRCLVDDKEKVIRRLQVVEG